MLGQFYTENYAYIFQKMEIPLNIENIIEPFAGEGHLFELIDIDKRLESYDIEPKHPSVIKRDTLFDPPSYENKYILTNPPFLARNKCKDKKIFDKYKQNDLYKCFISCIIKEVCLGGMIILPLNFLCSIRKGDVELRKEFLEKYQILKVNVFEKQVFKDTSYTVCSIQFERRNNNTPIEFTIFADDIKVVCFDLNKENNYTIGGEIYFLKHKN